jgi:hypothetical protein
MFELPEDALTWEVVGKWTTKDTDLDYSIIVKYQPIGSSFHPDGKPYRIHVMYFLKGTQLFIATLRCDGEAKDFQSKSLIDLGKCSLMTEPMVSRKPPLFLSISDRASYWGEKFFFASTAEDMPPYHAAFTLRFPETNCYYDWEEVLKFSSAVKRRIHQEIAKGAQGFAPNA